MSNINLQKRIIIYSLRYSLGRMTGAVDDVITTIKQSINLFKSWEIERIISEIENYPNLGMECDKIQWMNFVEYLKEEM